MRLAIAAILAVFLVFLGDGNESRRAQRGQEC